MSYRHAAVVAALALAVSCEATQDSPRTPPTLGQLRQAIGDSRQGGGHPADTPLDLAGYSFHWELTTGSDFTVVVISRNLKGQIAVFSSAGVLTASVDTGEAQSVQLCDLDTDGVAEIITDEVKERGTGLLTRKFGVYQASGTSIRTVWEGVSFGHLFHARGGETPHFSSASGYLRCDSSGGDRPRPRLIYVFETDDGRGKTNRSEVALELEGGKLVERTAPAKSPSELSHQER